MQILYVQRKKFNNFYMSKVSSIAFKINTQKKVIYGLTILARRRTLNGLSQNILPPINTNYKIGPAHSICRSKRARLFRLTLIKIKLVKYDNIKQGL